MVPKQNHFFGLKVVDRFGAFQAGGTPASTILVLDSVQTQTFAPESLFESQPRSVTEMIHDGDTIAILGTAATTVGARAATGTVAAETTMLIHDVFAAVHFLVYSDSLPRLS